MLLGSAGWGPHSVNAGVSRFDSLRWSRVSTLGHRDRTDWCLRSLRFRRDYVAVRIRGMSDIDHGRTTQCVASVRASDTVSSFGLVPSLDVAGRVRDRVASRLRRLVGRRGARLRNLIRSGRQPRGLLLRDARSGLPRIAVVFERRFALLADGLGPEIGLDPGLASARAQPQVVLPALGTAHRTDFMGCLHPLAVAHPENGQGCAPTERA